MDTVQATNQSPLCLEGVALNYNRDATIHGLFEQQADSAAAGDIAVLFEQQSITYAELDQRSNQLAHHLLGLGVKPNTLVALCVERSIDMLVGLLGILKAGGAYIPLDPTYPADRLSYMLSDSEAPLLLTEQALLPELPEHKAQSVCLDRDWPAIAEQPASRCDGQAGPTDLAYVIYTSGSTGRPKGVEIPHCAVVNFLISMAREPGLSATDRLLAVTTLSFDIAGLELYLPLSIGARVVLASRQVAGDGVLLQQLITQSGATVMQATPATWRLLLQSDWAGNKQLRVFCGGETLPADLAAELLPRCAELWNLYGPTEATIWATVHRVESANKSVPVPIGRPIANCQIYLLDDDFQPTPAGQAGEIYIGGESLARGYLKRPELTAQRFIANPLPTLRDANAIDTRLYRTGDLGKVLADGTLEHMGRVDYQVKIRGFRIELGEIEAALAQHDGVAQAVLLAREDSPGDKRLVAYIIPKSDPVPTIASLREEAAKILPDYMVPGIFVFLDQLPLTPNGKIDRSALPAPDTQRPKLAQNYIAARTLDEEKMAAIWAEVLRVDTVGVEDNFFELGGDSLKVAQIVTRIRDVFEINVPLKSLFESQTIRDMMAVVADNERADSQGTELPITTVSRTEAIPLSFSQERVWFTHQLNARNLAYNFQSSIRFRGSLDVKALERSLSEIVRRHEGYRTSYPERDGRPVQVIHRHEPLTLPVVDFADTPKDERDAAARDWCDGEFQHRFDLGQLPMMKWTLLRYSDDDHTLIHMEHHLVHDGWSFNMFLHELVELYQAYSAGQPSPLPELKVQFADFAAWQHAWMQGTVADTQLAYWREKLQALPPLLELPVGRPRPAQQSFRGTSLRPEVHVELIQALRTLSRQERSTLFMTMLAAYIALLHRYSNETDIPVGTFFANRRNRDSEPLIGMILNNTVIRSSLAANPTVSELIHQVRDTVLEAGNYQDVPFNRVVTDLQPKRDPSYNPLFQFMFSFHDEPMPEHTLEGLDVRVTPVLTNGSAKFDLGVIGIPHSSQHLGLRQGANNDGLTMIWEHNTDIFPTATINRMITHYMGILEAMVANPEQRVSELSLVGAAEREQLLTKWNATAADYPRDQCLHQLFQAQAVRSPDAIAVVYNDQTMTYRTLDQRSNQMARHLRGLGVNSGVLVAISVNRSLDMLVGLLGILKAGGTYVPIDPLFPADRKAFMLEDSAAAILVTQESLRSALPSDGITVVCLDSHRSAIDGGALADTDSGPEDLAYVIYTSGSTGNPKGVQIPHRAVVNFLATMGQKPGLTVDDRLLAVTTLSFDIAGLELYLPLTVGARVIIVSRDTTTNGEELAKQMAATGTTVMQATPSTWQMLIDSGWHGSDQLTVLCGGEPLPRALAEQLLTRVKAVWNMYGPTETTIWSAVDRVESDTGLVPIGRPIGNTQIYVLDEQFRPLPIGVVGELCIGGEGVALGYLNQPELTAEKFIDNPFIPSAKIYRTGDLARYRDDGTLECLGRNDHQIKLRGFRIELGEIETVLGQHEMVQQAAVMMREDVPGDKRLVGYIVPAASAAPSHAELLEHLRQSLPDYMVPTAFVTLLAFPLTPNEKVDRRALPAPSGAREDNNQSYTAPRNSTEQKLAEIWEQVLNVSPIGVFDDFFDVGGHSLLAMSLIAQIDLQMGKRITLTTLFNGRTIDHLARVLGDVQGVAGESPFIAVQAGGSQPPFFAGGSHPRYVDAGRQLGTDQPFYRFDVYAMQAQRVASGEKPLKRIEDVAAKFVDEIRAVQPNGPFHLGGGCEAAIVAFEAALQLQRQGQEVACLVMWLAPPLEAWKMSLRQSVPFRLGRQIRFLLTDTSLFKMSSKELSVFLSHQWLEYRIFRSIDRYRPDDIYRGKIILIRTAKGSASSHEKLNKQWEDLATEGVEVHVLPGDHNTWLNDEAKGFSRLLEASFRESPN